MNNSDLYKLLEIPCEVVEQLQKYEQTRKCQIPDSLRNKILNRDSWDDGIKELQELLGDDQAGFKILWELLNLICNYSYDNYVQRIISDDIFVETMKFCTRFLHEYYRTYGRYKFVWAWWYPRQISLKEFRIGALEYEFVEGEAKEISVHIPSDADLCKESVLKSIEDFCAFRREYFPQWENVELVCDSWLLSPALKELLDADSNILAFQNMFEIDSVDYEATWFMGWIFPGYESVDSRLPEKTSLQRRMKAYLLEGKKVGCAKGHLKGKG